MIHDVAAAMISALLATAATATAPDQDGLKVWITRGGSYCIRELAVFGKLRCQSEAAWSKEGVTFTRSISVQPSSTPPALSSSSSKTDRSRAARASADQ